MSIELDKYGLPWIWNYWEYEGYSEKKENGYDVAEFHDDESEAESSEWVRRRFWTVDEATALTFGKNPSVVNWDKMHNAGGEFPEYYGILRELILAAQLARELPELIRPEVYVEWTKLKRISFCHGLEDEIKERQEEYDELKRKVAVLEEESERMCESLQRQIEQLKK